jgi:hypothetical protein
MTKRRRGGKVCGFGGSGGEKNLIVIYNLRQNVFKKFLFTKQRDTKK